jgi:hypothetical protein
LWQIYYNYTERVTPIVSRAEQGDWDKHGRNKKAADGVRGLLQIIG